MKTISTRHLFGEVVLVLMFGVVPCAAQEATPSPALSERDDIRPPSISRDFTAEVFRTAPKSIHLQEAESSPPEKNAEILAEYENLLGRERTDAEDDVTMNMALTLVRSYCMTGETAQALHIYMTMGSFPDSEKYRAVREEARDNLRAHGVMEARDDLNPNF